MRLWVTGQNFDGVRGSSWSRGPTGLDGWSWCALQLPKGPAGKIVAACEVLSCMSSLFECNGNGLNNFCHFGVAEDGAYSAELRPFASR